MADGVTISADAVFNALSDEVTLGSQTGHKQLIGILDATDGGTNRAAVDSSGRLTVASYELPVTSGGLTLASPLIAAASTNQTVVKASAGQVYWVYVFNAAGTTQYVKFVNKATTPTAGTDTVVLCIPVPGGSAATFSPPTGLAFSTGIGYFTVTGIANSDATAVAVNSLVVNVGYK